MPADYLIVGAGSAGCVLAERLSSSGGRSVLLLEAGPADRHPMIHMPKGMARLFSDPRHVWFFETTPERDIPAETWIRGKVLGGSSSVNGMMYFRGHPEDYNEWVRRGATGWGWEEMRRVFHEIESTALRISVPTKRTALTEAFIAAGQSLGLPRVEELSDAQQEGVGYPTQTVSKGRRQSAADAFLRPALSRRNLRVETGVTIDRVLFEGKRAVGVAGHRGEVAVEYRTPGEVILAAGALQSPQLLERSGIGGAERLRTLGVRSIHHSPGVGENLLEHRLLMMQYEVLPRMSMNVQYHGWRLALHLARYALTRTGPMATGSHDVGAFVKTPANVSHPDVEILMAPYSLTPTPKGIATDSSNSIHLFGYPLRSRSQGSVHIRSAERGSGAVIRPNYLSDSYDQQVTIAMFRLMRRWIREPALQGIVGTEVLPGAGVEDDDTSILHAFRAQGAAGYHACGTARMGGDDAVVDARLRVRGVSSLRVIDGSVMPTMVSANTNAPIMAVAWRAAELIRDEERN
jgi:choline dehydrogenase